MQRPEALAEVRQVVETYGVGHFRHAARAAGQQLGGAAQAQHPHKIGGGLVGESFEFAEKMYSTQGHRRREDFDVESRVSEVFFDYGQGAGQKLLVGRGNGNVAGLQGHFLGKALAQQAALGQQVGHPHTQLLGPEGLGEVVVGPGLEACEAAVGRGAGREQHHRDVAGALVGFEAAAQLQAIEVGHHQVAQYKVGQQLGGAGQAGAAVGGADEAVISPQAAGQVAPHINVVVDDEHQWARVGGVGGVGGVGRVDDFGGRDGAAYCRRLGRRGSGGGRRVGGQGQGGRSFRQLMPFQMGRAQRQADGKGRAFALHACHGHATVVQAHQFFYQGQTNAGTLVGTLAGVVHLVKAVENKRQVGSRNAASCIGHPHRSRTFSFGHRHHNATAGRGKFQGVAQ